MGMGRDADNERLTAEVDAARARLAKIAADSPGAPFGGAVVQCMLDGFALLDARGVHLEVNPALCAMTGFSREELIGVGAPHPYWPPEELDAIRAAFARTLAGEAGTLPLTFMRASGERFPVFVTPAVIRDAGGEVVAAFATVKDMTELRRAEEARQETENLFRLTFDQAPVGAVLAGRDFRFQRVNDAFCRFIGYDAAELLQLGFPDLTHPDDVAADVAGVSAVTAGEASDYTREKRYVRKDGAVVWGSVTVRPLRGAGDEFLASLAIITDITARKLAEDEADLAAEELAKERDRLSAIVASLPDELWFSDAEGRFTLANQAAQRVFGAGDGMPVAELAGSLEVLRPDGTPRPVDEAPPLRALRGEVVRDQEEIVRTPATGELRHRLVNSTPVTGHDGVVVGSVSIVRDVTELHRAEEALRASETRYRLLVQNANDAVYVHEISPAAPGRIIEVNDRACEMLGYTRDELLQLDIAALDTPQQIERSATISGALLESGSAVFETEHVRSDGSLVPVEISVRIFELDGRPVALSVARDVTERRLAVEALREMEALRDLSETVARVASWRWDLATRKATWSPGMFVLFDADPDAFDGDVAPLLAERVHPDDLPGLLERTEAVAEGGPPVPVEFRVRHRDGSEHVLHGEGTVERDAEGRPVAISGYYQDVTEQRLVEDALRDAETRFRAMFEQSPLPLVEQDFSTVRERLAALVDDAGTDLAGVFESHPREVTDLIGQIRNVDVNAASLELLGVATKDELLHDFQRFILMRTSALPLRRGLEELAAGAGKFEGQLQLLDAGGAIHTVDMYAQVAPGHEEALDRVLVSFVDVTERVRAEAEVRRLNAELERRIVSRTAQRDALNRELESFAYSASHDLRTPLRAIDGFSAVLMEDARDRLTPEDLENLERVRTAAQRMGSLIDAILGLSHATRRSVTRTNVDVSAAAKDVLSELLADAPDRQVEWRVESGMTASADRAMVRVVLYHLLDNALKFTSKHASARIEVGASETARGRAFFVRDDGAGFDPQYAEHLFGAFQRLHLASDFPGDGVGLATVQRLIVRHGGAVWAESRPEAGVTFFFTLPDEAEPGS